MKKHICLLFCICIMSMLHVSAQAWLQQQKLPHWVVYYVTTTEFDSLYTLSDHLNPFYLEADFNGDNTLDAAIIIKHKVTGKTGIMIVHNQSFERFILGAGTFFGNGGDDFDWMDIWKVHRELDTQQMVFDENGEYKGSIPLHLKSPGIYVEKSESAGGLIYWNGTKYLWAQMSD